MYPEIAELIGKIKDFDGRKLLLITHRNADFDAIASAALFQFLALAINPDLEVDIYVPVKLSSLAIPLKDFLEIDTLETIESHALYDVFVFVDVGGSEVLEEAEILLHRCKMLWLIDHHIHDKEFLSYFAFSVVKSEEVSSTCEIIASACKVSKIDLPRKLLVATLAAIWVESRFLRAAKCETFSLIAEICRKGINFKDVSSLFTTKRDFSAKIATLKTLKRMEIYRCKDWLVVFSKVGAYQRDASNILSNIGIDFVAVGGEIDEGCKVRIQISPRFHRIFNLTAGGDFISILTETFEGTGGGHPTIGATSLKSSLDEVFLFLKRFLKKRFQDSVDERLVKISER